MGPVLAIKYFRFTYRSNAINKLQQAEHFRGPVLSLGNVEPQITAVEKDVAPLSIAQPRARSPICEPLLTDSPATRRSLGPSASLDFFQATSSRFTAPYSRNCKDN